MEKTEGPQSKAAKVVDRRVVVHDLTVISETTTLEVDETTPSNPIVRDAILDQLVKNIASDLALEDVSGPTSPAGLEPVKLIEKKKESKRYGI